MQRYEKYKDSGVDWIGEIPEHWKMLSNKYIFPKDGNTAIIDWETPQNTDKPITAKKITSFDEIILMFFANSFPLNKSFLFKDKVLFFVYETLILLKNINETSISKNATGKI